MEMILLSHNQQVSLPPCPLNAKSRVLLPCPPKKLRSPSTKRKNTTPDSSEHWSCAEGAAAHPVCTLTPTAIRIESTLPAHLPQRSHVGRLPDLPLVSRPVPVHGQGHGSVLSRRGRVLARESKPGAHRHLCANDSCCRWWWRWGWWRCWARFDCTLLGEEGGRGRHGKRGAMKTARNRSPRAGAHPT